MIILILLLWLMGVYNSKGGCVREVSLAQVNCMCMWLRPLQWVRGQWRWGYGGTLLSTVDQSHCCDNIEQP